MRSWKFGAGLLTLVWAGTAMAAPPPQSPELLAKGKSAFTVNCVPCHGEKGDGTGPAAAALEPKPRNFAKDEFKKGAKPEQVFETLTKGIEGTAMAPFAHLPEEDRWALVYAVLELRGPGPKPAAPAKAAPAKPAAPAKKGK